MKDFSEMTFEEKVARMREVRKDWQDLERNDPEEYQRKVSAMQPIVERYDSEMGIGDDKTDDEE